jgi:hypothetical protein
MSVVGNFILPSGYGCLALIDPKTYVTFVGENWQLEELIDRVVSEVNQHHAIAWGCVYGNWILEIHDSFSGITGYREVSGIIDNSEILLLAKYESLTWVAQFADNSFPLKGMEDFQLNVSPGTYLCRVIQLFPPDEAESEEVFYQKTPHFIIELTKNNAIDVPPWSEIPWFLD